MAMIVEKSIGSKVFANELPGLPPDKEIESGIELEPTMAPTHKAPYSMPHVELEEVRLHSLQGVEQGDDKE